MSRTLEAATRLARRTALAQLVAGLAAGAVSGMFAGPAGAGSAALGAGSILLGTLLIGLVHKRRIGSLDPVLSSRRPWLTALHWAHFSPLQLLFLVVMIAIMAASRLGYSLTQFMPG